ncbi:MAG: rod shape-determining protein MreC [Candidatus Vogelbacteria bacterium]|nr:rod shape-determining protein MreC [Candidatus Vogelbacteria bacterium]
MTIRPYRRNSNHSNIVRSSVLIIALALVFATVFTLARDRASTLAIESAAGLWRARISLFSRAPAELSAYISELEGRLAPLSALELENRELKALLNARTADTSDELILAGVLVRPPQSPFDMLIIDIGSEDGVHQGDLAVIGQSVLGVVRATGPRFAKVELLSSAGRETPVLVGEGRMAMEIEGLGGGSFRIQIPRDIHVSIGDAIILPGTKGWVVGMIESMDDPGTDAFEFAYGAIAISPRELRFVEIVRE